MNISDIIWALGIPTTYHRHNALKICIQLCYEDEDRLLLVTKRLYPEVAEILHTTPQCVERNLRTVVQYCWTHGNRRLLSQMAHYPIMHQPTNSEFISIICGYLKRVEKREREERSASRHSLL